MKSMKFGQKGDTRPAQLTPAQPTPPAVAMTNNPSDRLASRQPTTNLSLAAMQGNQSGHHLALLRTLANSQQQLPSIDAGELRASQVLAMGGLQGTNEYENQLRNRLLLAGLTSSLPSVHRPSALVHPQLQHLQGFAGNARRLSGLDDISLGLTENRSSSLLRSTIPGSADLHRSLVLSARGRSRGVASATAAALDPRISNSLLESCIPNQSQLTTSAQMGPPQIPDSLRLLRLQQASGASGDASAELLMLIEQERQLKLNEQG